MKEIKKMLTHVFTPTANPLNSRRRREGDGRASRLCPFTGLSFKLTINLLSGVNDEPVS